MQAEEVSLSIICLAMNRVKGERGRGGEGVKGGEDGIPCISLCP